MSDVEALRATLHTAVDLLCDHLARKPSARRPIPAIPSSDALPVDEVSQALARRELARRGWRPGGA